MFKEILLLAFFILVLDALFIGFYAIDKWRSTILDIQGSKLSVNYLSAIFVYVLIIIGVMLFVYPTSSEKVNYENLFKYAFMWGFITYGIFDFTNLSIFQKYPLELAMIDSIWGGILVATSVIMTHYICNSTEMSFEYPLQLFTST